ncbi:MAG TPA: L,D-transpeptidase family protein [Solirubrobacteraceae bacterium]|jgi:peptidoglycan hydrolase-like protein with peptidoglycan-binding domain|nr:L,D-transpeptidase family protein [Solirubrobacteraceae bacterium]
MKRGLPMVGLAAVVASLLAAGIAGATVTTTTPTPAPSSPTSTPTTPTAPLPATKVVSLPPATVLDGAEPLVVTFNAPLDPASPAPMLNPAVAGSWRVVSNSEVFTPASTLNPCSSYTLTVWSQSVASAHTPVGKRRTAAFNVACPPLAGAQQALARLGYLGARFKPRYTVHLTSGSETRREAALLAFHPPRGALVSDPSGAPAVDLGQLDATTRGALVVYQSEHGIEASGEPNRETWNSLISSEAANRRNPDPYTWVSVSEQIPETLEVHRGSHVALSTPANTGVAGAETATGIFPIYSRLVSTTMTGTDPDGTKYVAPDVPWVNYFNGGDAVHGYPRASYGSPQSNGCVELPIETAHTVFGMLRLGDIVEVKA